VEIPDRPTKQQVRWLHEMEDAKGTDFDDIFVMRLRAAHGKIFPIVGAIRASTENEIVRKLAQSANNFVLTHITLLESTGLVAYEELSKTSLPPTEPAKAANQSGVLAGPVVWIILAVALVAGAVVTSRMMRPATEDDEPLGRRPSGPAGPRGTGIVPVQSGNAYSPPHGVPISSGSRSRR
jgi:hypothetical protein